MTEAKIHFKLGLIEFSAEGEKAWVNEQIDKLLEKAPALIKMAPPLVNKSRDQTHSPMGADPDIAEQSLAKFLKDKKATSNQVEKFLATAVWLEAKGKDRLSTNEITKALSSNNQGGLTNPSTCLNKNVGKGFCEKDGRAFFVTEEGKTHLQK